MGLPNCLSFGLTADRSAESLWPVDSLVPSSFARSRRRASEVLQRTTPFMSMLDRRFVAVRERH